MPLQLSLFPSMPVSSNPVPVFVYRNLHKRCWSVKDRSSGKVIAHPRKLVVGGVRGCFLKVSLAGRNRVLEERVKNVHAGVAGEWISDSFEPLVDPIQITYNPYKFPYFVDINGMPVRKAQSVEFKEDGTAWAIGLVPINPHLEEDVHIKKTV
jgi:hypothetical protein